MLELGVVAVIGGLLWDGFLILSQLGNPTPSQSPQPSLVPGLIAAGVGVLLVLAHYVAKFLA